MSITSGLENVNAGLVKNVASLTWGKQERPGHCLLPFHEAQNLCQHHPDKLKMKRDGVDKRFVLLADGS